MCGIIGAVAQRNVSPVLLEGLRRLEYRGYDSAGMATLSDDKILSRLRITGKVEKLSHALTQTPCAGHTGIAHTRWATHGEPSESNAHPHMSGSDIALVHNGIIENHHSLRKTLSAMGYVFESETDTEIIVHLIHHELKTTDDFLSAVQRAAKKLDGAFSLAILHKDEPHRLIAVRNGSPLIIGLGIDEFFIASDIIALSPVAHQFIYMEEQDVADITLNGVNLYDGNGNMAARTLHTPELSCDAADRGTYRHHMLKEINEQPRAIRDTLHGNICDGKIADNIFGESATGFFKKVKHLHIIACGTSYHTSLVARHWIEQITQIPCHVEVASEYRYRDVAVPEDCLFVTLSQSGETADILAALKKAKTEDYLATLSICNAAHSSLVRESDFSFLTRAGIEVGVASTKAFTAQLIAMLLLTFSIAKQKNIQIDTSTIESLALLPSLLEATLKLDTTIQNIAHLFAHKQHTLFLGRGAQYPIALEGALKLKEISYIHAEAYPAGELKHGPLALVDPDMLVVALAPNTQTLQKMQSNLNEVLTRGGQLLVFADEHIDIDPNNKMTVINMPSVSALIAPILYAIPLQLLAYHVAVLKGTDVDQPRNLAKSVTVE